MKESVCVWPCGTWCRPDKVEETMVQVGIGDDFETVILPGLFSDAAVDAFLDARSVHQRNRKQYPLYMGHDNQGLVFINLEGRDSIYRVDAAIIPMVREKFVHAPWKALNLLIGRCEWYIDQGGRLHECI